MNGLKQLVPTGELRGRDARAGCEGVVQRIHDRFISKLADLCAPDKSALRRSLHSGQAGAGEVATASARERRVGVHLPIHLQIGRGLAEHPRGKERSMEGCADAIAQAVNSFRPHHPGCAADAVRHGTPLRPCKPTPPRTPRPPTMRP